MLIVLFENVEEYVISLVGVINVDDGQDSEIVWHAPPKGWVKVFIMRILSEKRSISGKKNC